MLIGLMVTSDTHENNYFTEIAKTAKSFNMKVCKFTPENIDMELKKVRGERFDAENETWIPTSFDLPDFVYDRCFHGLSRETTETRDKIDWLKDHSNFLGLGLPGKWEVYQILKKHPLLQAFFPETFQVTTSEDIIGHLERLDKVIIKPEFGAGGTGIYLLTKTEEGTLVSMTKKGTKYDRPFTSTSQLNKWLQHLLNRYRYLCQPYLELRNQKNEPFDLRILLQKNEKNQWMERGRGIRTGQKDSITSNLATGGEAISLDIFNKNNPEAITIAVEQKIQHILRTLPAETEAVSKRLFELGIDLGIDKKGQIWIMDINSKPGRKIIQILQPETMKDIHRAPLQYSQYLAEHLQKAGE
ncbi:Endospore coat-associated protein YheD [Peribacillus sp. Bi96]|uniref:YheC/YheD family endospore coat-associated protein n=1 Tax=unclassified Peribacillus TaxID=2675266 RepID=UPI001D8A728F|nr:YheC/YheD family protein [Peribacillus sp. Bi96]CAH0221560.1 Endospore coat-associated protein YheD [Peribacillus sp. Bi96]